MRTPDFAEFADCCAQQSVRLHPDLRRQEDFELGKGEYITFAPSAMLSAVAMAGHLLRQDRRVELADSQVELSDDLAGSGLAKALADVINHSLEPLPADSDIPSFRGRGRSADACFSADHKFSTSIRAVELGVGTGQIIGDEDGPLLLRKMYHGVRSALSLRQLAVNGIPYPAGSIFHIKLSAAGLRRDPVPAGVEAVDASRVKELDFMRFSVFALSQAERQNHFRRSCRTADLMHRSIDSIAIAMRRPYLLAS